MFQKYQTNQLKQTPSQPAINENCTLQNQLDNIQFIDQSAPDLTPENLKGYRTLDEKSSYPTKLKSSPNSGLDDDVFVTPPQKAKIKTKTKGLGVKKKGRREKKSTENAAESSSSSSNGSGKKKELITRVQTITTDTETTKIVTTTSSLNRYTFTKIMDDKNQDVDSGKQLRTQSCSSIPVDDLIDNLAVFRKSFERVNIFEDETILNATKKIFKKSSSDEKSLTFSRENIRLYVNDMLTDIFESAIKIIIGHELAVEKPLKNWESKEKLIICRTADVVPLLCLPKIVQTPSTDNLMDARNFVEEYEEYHDSCSELPESELIANCIMSEITDEVDKIVTQKQKKRKDKMVKHIGVTHCIPVETDSNAEDDLDFPQNDKRLLEVGTKYNVPKNLFKAMNTEMTEITDQSIAENNPEMVVEQPQLVVVPKEGKDFVVEDDDDVYKPIAVSPCGRFFKYEEEVSDNLFK